MRFWKKGNQISTNIQNSHNCYTFVEMRLQFAPYVLKFKEPAGTSRGVLTEKITCILRIFDESDPSRFGIGEAAIFPGLSPEADDRFFYKLMELQANVRIGRKTDLSKFPSIQFGFEQAIRDFSSGCKGFYTDSAFLSGQSSIEINGLIWMGDYVEMKERIDRKLQENFKCIKLKIGAIDWKKEVELIEYIRNSNRGNEIEIRVDANGSFTMDNVIPRLHRLSELRVHSIEQPIKSGTPDLMHFLCDISPIPIALDEELIGKFSLAEKEELLKTIQPAYIVLKPSLIGGYNGTTEWIELAEKYNVGWWITSSLESNIGLNALAQWVATLPIHLPQGLGTGALFTNNFDSPLYLEGDKLKYNKDFVTDRSVYERLDWRE